MNGYTTPFDGNREVFENGNQVIAERDYLRIDNNNLHNENFSLKSQCNELQSSLSAIAAQAQSMNQANFNTIMRLNGVIASMKSEKELSSRTFTTDGYGNIWCIEPSKKKKEVGYIKITSSYIFETKKDSVSMFYIAIEYNAGLSVAQTAVIPFSDITDKKLIKHFPLFKIKCKKDVANDYIYELLMQIISNNPPSIKIPECPGITLIKENNIIKGAEFTCCENKLPDVFNDYISETYRQKILPATNKTPQKIFEKLKKHLKSNAVLTLMTFANTGILSTFLEFIHYDISTILVVSTNNVESESLTSCILKTYNRTKPPKSLTMSKYELTSILRSSKDETVVFKDDTVSDNCGKRINSLDTILSFTSDDKCKPFNTAIISNEVQYYIPQGKGIFLELDENFGKGYSEAERCELSDALNEMTRYFVDCFCQHIDEYGSELERLITETKKETKDDFSSDQFCTIYSVLYSVNLIWSNIFNVVNQSNFKEDLKNIIISSQNIETGKDLLIINSFFQKLNKLIVENKLSIKKLDRTMNYESNTDTAVIDGELMMMEESTIKRLFLSDITDANTVNGIFSALENQGYLFSTNGHKKPTTVYCGNGNPMHISFIAFKFADMVSDETIKYIDSLSNKQYFTNQDNISDFMPLIQNNFGQVAGQFLRRDENQHRFITGKSGSGKTVFLTQLMARLAQFGNRVVIFDSSDSFLKRELEKKLSKDFIEEHITFYDTDESGLPVHLLYTYEQDTRIKQKNMLADIFNEAIHDSTQNMLTFLKKVMKEYIEYSNCNYKDFYELLEVADTNKTEISTKESILKNIGHILEELIENESDNQKNEWFDFLNSCKDIVVIKLEESGGKNGSQLTDMLLASLFYAQKHQSEYRQLSIFIDEIQNQNLSDGSIISKIMREGRKYAIDLNFATQNISNVSETRILRQASFNICFKPEITSRNALATMLGFKKKDIWKIDNMSTGECFIQGSVVNFDLGGRDETVIYGKTLLLPDSPLNSK